MSGHSVVLTLFKSFNVTIVNHRLTILTLSFIIAANLTCFAQQFTLGLTGGVHTYKVSFHHAEEDTLFVPKAQLGYKFGGFIEFPLANNFSWAVEGYYSFKGRKVSNPAGTITNTAQYNFYEISVLLRKGYPLSVNENLRGAVFFNVGPNINYWAKGKGTLDSNVDLDYTVKFQDRADDITTNAISDANRWLFGLEIGAGIEARIYEVQFVNIELRYTYGHTYLGERNSSYIPVLGFDDSLRSNYRVLTLLIRYGIDLDLKNARKGKSTYKKAKGR